MIDTLRDPVLNSTLDGFSFTGVGRNLRDGCAASVKGTAEFFDASGTRLESANFRLPDGEIVLGRSGFLFDGCCLSPTGYKKMDGGTIKIGFAWTNVKC
jgi:hypothetical protein